MTPRPAFRFISALILSAWFAQVSPAETTIEEKLSENRRFTVITVPVADGSLKLLQNDGAGTPLRTFARLEAELKAQGQTLLLAMNAGMFHADSTPVGWCVSGGREVAPLNTGNGEGNFFLLPNGVFGVQDGRARVVETGKAKTALSKPELATQSGPLLLAGGAQHPAIRPNSPNRKIRNAAGVSADGKTVFLVMSREAVTFHELAVLFRDVLKCPDALYLDGVVSQLHAPSFGFKGNSARFGPFLAVVQNTAPPSR